MAGVTLRETVRVVRGCLPLLPYHLDRLASGGVPDSVLAAIAPSAEATAAACGPGVERLQILVAPRESWFSVDADTHPSTLAVPGGPAIVPVTVSALPELPPNAAKPADRAYWDGAQRLARLRGGQQAVLVSAEGDVVDGGTATVWAVEGRTLVTPPAPPAIAGVARRLVLEDMAPAFGLSVEVRRLPLAELESADEVLLSNAVGGIVAARGRGGEVATALSEAWAALEASCGEG